MSRRNQRRKIGRITGEVNGTEKLGFIKMLLGYGKVKENSWERLDLGELKVLLTENSGRDDGKFQDNKIGIFHIKYLSAHSVGETKGAVFLREEYGELEIENIEIEDIARGAVLFRECKIGKLKIGYIDIDEGELERCIEDCEIGEIEVENYKGVFDNDLQEIVYEDLANNEMMGNLSWRFTEVGNGEIEIIESKVGLLGGYARKRERVIVYRVGNELRIAREEGGRDFWKSIQYVKCKDIEIGHLIFRIGMVDGKRIWVREMEAKKGALAFLIQSEDFQIEKIEIDGVVERKGFFRKISAKKMGIGHLKASPYTRGSVMFVDCEIGELEIQELEVSGGGVAKMFKGCRIEKLRIGKHNLREEELEELLDREQVLEIVIGA